MCLDDIIYCLINSKKMFKFFFLAEIAQLWEHQPLSPSHYGLLPFSEPLVLASGSVATISIATSHPYGLILHALQPGLVCSIEV